ncbi:MAG: Lrp/AsnC family transcriptional regulator [Syntrophomonas sp.]
MIYDLIDKEIIKFLQGNLPLESRPYKGLAERLDLTEQEIVLRIENMKRKGIIRRLGAILRHYQAGYNVNALVVWKVAASQADHAGQIMAGFNEISHCYLRDVPKGFDYNLFTMIHSHSDENLAAIINEVSCQTGIKKYLIIRSVKELKKVSMTYF